VSQSLFKFGFQVLQCKVVATKSDVLKLAQLIAFFRQQHGSARPVRQIAIGAQCGAFTWHRDLAFANVFQHG